MDFHAESALINSNESGGIPWGSQQSYNTVCIERNVGVVWFDCSNIQSWCLLSEGTALGICILGA